LELVSLLPQMSQWDDRIEAFARAMAVKFADFLPRLFAAFLVLLAFWIFHRFLQRILNRTLFSGRFDFMAADIVRKLVKYVILGLGLLMAASQLGFDIVSMLAGLGVAGLAVGLAAKDTLSNFIAGLIILWDRPFALGDDVEIAGVEGLVRHIELRATKLETLDGNDVIIPNGEVVSKNIVNYTRTPRVRVRVPLAVAHGAEAESVRQALLELPKGDERVLSEPAPSVDLMDMSGPSLLFELRFWIGSPRTRNAVRSEYLEKAKRALREADILIPAGPGELIVWERTRQGEGEKKT
jgi:small conductance mechanosensitive channel